MSAATVKDDRETAPPGWTEYWAACPDCGWEGPVRSRPLKAQRDADDHECPVPR